MCSNLLFLPQLPFLSDVYPVMVRWLFTGNCRYLWYSIFWWQMSLIAVVLSFISYSPWMLYSWFVFIMSHNNNVCGCCGGNGFLFQVGNSFSFVALLRNPFSFPSVLCLYLLDETIFVFAWLAPAFVLFLPVWHHSFVASFVRCYNRVRPWLVDFKRPVAAISDVSFLDCRCR